MDLVMVFHLPGLIDAVVLVGVPDEEGVVPAQHDLRVGLQGLLSVLPRM